MDDQIEWVVDALNDGSVTANEVGRRFSEEFLSSISPATVVATIARLHDASARRVAVTRDGDGVGAEVRLSAGADQWIPQGATAEIVRAILGANPGVEFDDEWSYVGFKGGGEVGLLSLAWYLESDRGTYVYVVNVTNEHEPLPETQLVGLAQTAIELLASQ